MPAAIRRFLPLIGLTCLLSTNGVRTGPSQSEPVNARL